MVAINDRISHSKGKIKPGANSIVTVHLAFGTKSAIFLCSSGQMKESLSVRVAQ